MTAANTAPRAWLRAEDCDLGQFRAVVEQRTELTDYPYAAAVEDQVVIYGPGTADAAKDPSRRAAVQAEIAHALMDGPGIVVFREAFDPAVVDRASATFTRLLDEQKASGVGGGDHFAPPGANDRLWSALEKLAIRDPATFTSYYANDIIALAAVAWLGPNYQVVSDLNVVNPGGTAQVPHRDYHLGFMDVALAAQYPAHVHRLSPSLTLQGAIAHCDMPIETGPTMYLPHSQKYELGYLGVSLAEFRQYFSEHYVQLPLAKGDAVFFSPALIHGAGTNRSRDVRRMANLLQISSAFGRPLGTVDRDRVCRALYPELRRARSAGLDERSLRNIIASSAEGYPFPTNLDRDQPIDSLNPESQAELMGRALNSAWTAEQFDAALRAFADRHRSTFA